MKLFFAPSRRSFLLAAVPVALAFASCGNDDDDTPATPSQGRVLVSHAAASANVAVKALANDIELSQVTYGQTAGYVNAATGSPTIKINVASSNQTAASQTLTIDRDQNYSVFAYAATPTTVGILTTPDDLTAPASGQAKIRVVHVALNAPSPVKLSQQTIAGPVDIAGVAAAFPTVSSFVTVPIGSYNLLVTAGSTSTTVVAVGDGTGSGTGNKTYEAGKIYTVLVRGISGNLDPNLQPKAVLIQHN